MNKIYEKFYSQKLFSINDANRVLKNYQVCKNTLTRLTKSKLIKRLTNGLYYVVPIDDSNFIPDMIHVGSKIRERAIFKINTALYLHNLVSYDDTIYIASNWPGKIRIKDTTYKFLKDRFDFGIDKIEYRATYKNNIYTTIEIELTDIERTILDILYSKTLKTDDLIRILKEKKPRLRFKNIEKYLEKYKRPILYNKAGVLFTITGLDVGITEADTNDLKKKLSKKIYYIREKGLSLIKPRYKYLKDWNIMVPEKILQMYKEAKT